MLHLFWALLSVPSLSDYKDKSGSRNPRRGRVERELAERIEEFLPELPRATEMDTDVVYIIQGVDGGPVKIGHSTYKGMKKRLLSLQVGNHSQLVIRGLFSGGMWLEKALHEYFRDSRLKGEWFSLTKDLLILCPEVVAPGEVPRTRRLYSGYMRREHGWT